MQSEWSTGLVNFQQHTPEYAWALACPCLVMENIANSMINGVQGPNATRYNSSCCISSLISIVLDIPLIFCCSVAQNRTRREWFLLTNPNYRIENKENPYNIDEDDDWDPSKTSYDWWTLDWCWFYSNAALENCCTTCCCGPRIHMANFPSSFAFLTASIYPLCICPMAYFLRHFAKKKLSITHENELQTCAISACCLPCSLVQMQHSLR